LNDNLGVNSSHFFKSGNLIRPEEDMRKLVKIRELLPTKLPNKVRLEYDIWYDTGDPNRIHGYTYTDVLQKFIMLRACSDAQSAQLAKECISERSTNEYGQKIIDDIVNNNKDKYKLKKYRDSEKFVIFLPGTNIYTKMVDQEKCKALINEHGAKLKMHPLTSDTLKAHLKRTYGQSNLIDNKLSGHQVLEECETVGCSYNSEMGIVGTLKNKNFVFIGKDKKEQTTYKHIYSSVFDEWELGHFGENDSYRNRLVWFFSSYKNGMIYVDDPNAKEKIKNFFNYYRDRVHVAPKNINP
jgi:hypothetical protein